MQIFIVISLFSLTANPLVWTTKAPLPQILAGSACAVFNDTIYVVGGRDQTARYTTNYVYDPLTDNWSTKSSMSVARAHIGAGVVNGKMYVIGGWVGSTASGVVEEYDFSTNTWTTKATMPTPRYVYAIATVADKIYVIGGMNMSGNIFNTVEEYDPLTDTWTTKSPMPTARMGPACAVIRDTIYVFGGSTSIGGGATTINQCYDPLNDTWISKANMQAQRYCLGGWTFDNHAYALGGYNYYSYHTTLEVYDPVSNSWSYDVSMQYARQSIVVGLLNDCVYIVGGWNNGPLSYNEEGWFETGIQEQISTPVPDITVSPNPFSKSTEIRIDPGTDFPSNQCAINIYDVSGRTVKNIRYNNASGQIAVQWDGRGDDGGVLPNGAYLLVITSQDFKQTKKMLLVR
ncbi:MAG: kelch repeat-containing protein [bacterium]